MRYSVLVAAITLSGCILTESPCGQGFERSGDTCVPVSTPEPFRGPDMFASNSEVQDSSDADLPPSDFEPPSPTPIESGDADVAIDEWSEFSEVLLVDRTEDDSAAHTPAQPGADVDALVIVSRDDDDERIGWAAAIVDSRINDPYDSNAQSDPTAMLLPPDGQAVSFGTQGAFVRTTLELQRPLRAGDRIALYELVEEQPQEDRLEIFICRADRPGLAGCRSLGIAEGGLQYFGLP